MSRGGRLANDATHDDEHGLPANRSAFGPQRARAKRRLCAELLALLTLLAILAFAFQGSRGLWGTDEGRYTNVALRMLDTGDYLVPSLNDETLHFSKPPLTYWSIAASIHAFGRSEWAVRFPNGLAFIATGLLIYGLGLRLVPLRPWLPTVIYATSLGPFAAANVVTADTLLTLWETLEVFAFVAMATTRNTPHQSRYRLLMWCGFGLAFATKGPPGLLPLLPILALRWTRCCRLPRIATRAGLAAFAAIGLSWFVVVVWSRPYLLEYFIRYELYDRLLTDTHNRNGDWLGAVRIYGAAFVVGTLPWLLWMPRTITRGWRLVTRRFWQERCAADSAELFLLLWLLLPLAVFCAALSRLPLYVLPLSVPIALLLAMRLEKRKWISGRWAPAALALTVAILLGIKWSAAVFPYHKDARQFARLIANSVPGHNMEEVIFLDYWPQYGLAFYLGAAVQELPLTPPHALCAKLQESEKQVFVVSEASVGQVRSGADACGHYHVHSLPRWQDTVLMTIDSRYPIRIARPPSCLHPGGW